MTTKRRKQEQALFAPRPRKPWRDDPYDPAHRTQLDTGPEELTPPGRTVDDPRNHPTESDEVMAALAIINAALAREDATIRIYVSTPEAEDEVYSAFRLAGLSRQECRAWELHCYGYDLDEIAGYMDRRSGDEPLSRQAVDTYIRRGRAKLRVWKSV